MNAKFHKSFAKQLGKHSSKAQAAFEKRLALFINHPLDVILSNHSLTGRWKGYRSINISGDLRAVYEEVDKQTAFFVAFGTHNELCGH